ncbi:MAG: hypothetical protein R2941_00025 [Desulfobacterales bacterium]
MKNRLQQIVSALMFVLILLGNPLPVFPGPFFQMDSHEEWIWALSPNNQEDPMIRPLGTEEWEKYMMQCREFQQEGEPYPDTAFMPAELSVWPGEPGTPFSDAGIFMFWGEKELPAGNYASAWMLDYRVDPDLSNATITVTVTPPGPPYPPITAISFGIQDINGNIRSWWWSVPAPIPYNVPTTVTINTSLTGITAANPVAGGYASNPAFDITKSQFFLADENAAWVGGPVSVPPFGTSLPRFWNYWHNLSVKPNYPGVYKGYYVKWTQPPVEIEKNIINGWDEKSLYREQPIIADDWQCKDNRPVTDIHWWGSFLGWNQTALPPVIPGKFHIGIWTDVPAGPNAEFSHPGELIWENYCDSFVWNFAGYDRDPRGEFKDEACFQFNQLLSQDEWFFQEPDPTGAGRVYWLSIAAIYEDNAEVKYPWGWKTRPHFFNDDAVRIYKTVNPDGSIWPNQLQIGAKWLEGQPIEWEGVSWDMAFELTTNAPDPNEPPDLPGDFDGDSKIGLGDAIGILQTVSGIRSK